MRKIPLYILLTVTGSVMIYPLLWLIGASFKTNDEIFSSVLFMSESIDMSVYKSAWETLTPYSMWHYYLNTFAIIIPRIFLTVISSVLVAYGFARFDFPFRRFFFTMLIAGMFIPSIVKILPVTQRAASDRR